MLQGSFTTDHAFAFDPGKEREYTTPVAPLLSRSVARPQGHRAQKAMVYTIFLGKQGKKVYAIGPERRVYTIEASDPEKKKGGFPRYWCILFVITNADYHLSKSNSEKILAPPINIKSALPPQKTQNTPPP